MPFLSLNATSMCHNVKAEAFKRGVHVPHVCPEAIMLGRRGVSRYNRYAVTNMNAEFNQQIQ